MLKMNKNLFFRNVFKEWGRRFSNLKWLVNQKPAPIGAGFLFLRDYFTYTLYQQPSSF